LETVKFIELSAKEGKNLDEIDGKIQQVEATCNQVLSDLHNKN